MELVHIANATFSSLRINHSLENLASKTKLSGLLKSTRLVPRDQASPPVWTGSHHRALRRGQAGEWWSQPGSNRRPSGCKPDALPAELWPRLKSRVTQTRCSGGSGRSCTSDLTLIRGAL